MATDTTSDAAKARADKADDTAKTEAAAAKVKADKTADTDATTAETKADKAEAKAETARADAVKARAEADQDAGVTTFEGKGVAVIVGGPAGEDITAGIPADQGTLRTREQSTCVVDSDRHVGNAVPGTKVCSYHTMHYDNDGQRRKDVNA